MTNKIAFEVKVLRTPEYLRILEEERKLTFEVIAHGHTSKEIATKLGLSTGTVETHRTNLMRKLKARNVAGLVVYAFRSGLIKLLS